jgi:hypothetical protein
MAPSKVIRVDDEVWQLLQRNAIPLNDTPNAVIRRLLGLDKKLFQANSQQTMAAVRSGRAPMSFHRLRSKRHSTANLDIWWYGIPPLGKTYNAGDEIEFVLDDFRSGRSGRAKIKLTGKTLDRVNNATKGSNGYVAVKIWRHRGDDNNYLYFGDRNDPESPLDVR